MESLVDRTSSQNETCRLHPQEAYVSFCVDCEENVCKKCYLRGEKHSKHEFVDLLEGVNILKQQVKDADHALCGPANNARQRQEYDTSRNKAVTAEVSGTINGINRTINDVINELETMRTNLTTSASQTAQQQLSVSSAQQADVLIDVHLRRSGLQGALQLHDKTDCNDITQLKLAKNVAAMKQEKLQRLGQRQQQRQEQRRQAAQAQRQELTIDEHWIQEMHTTLDYVKRLRQYTDTFATRNSGTRENQVQLLRMRPNKNFKLIITLRHLK